MGREVSVLHNYLCKKIGEKRENNLSPDKDLVIKTHDFRRMLGWFSIPHYIQTKVINEMKNMGLIKIQDKKNIILVRKSDDSGWFD